MSELFRLNAFLFSCFLLVACGSDTPAVQAEQSAVSETTASAAFVPHVGVWTGPKAYPLVEILPSGNGFRIRECYGPAATSGREYTAVLEDGKMMVQGPKESFYKEIQPVYGPVANNLHQMIYRSGFGKVELIKVEREMPDLVYAVVNGNVN